MKVLYVTGACLTKNTSANMSHNGFVKGLLDCGCDVDIIMASASWGEDDKALPKWEKANYYIYNSVSFADKLRNRYKQSESKTPVPETLVENAEPIKSKSIKQIARNNLKKLFYLLFPNDPVYPLERQWLKTALKFKSSVEYDVVISNSSPAASHRLVVELLKRKNLKCKKWIQIWEDPWYHDLYGGRSEAILHEEHFLLREAQEIYYVSPLTLMYQKQYFPDCEDKMKCVPLPFLEFGDECQDGKQVSSGSFGYFGDYYSQTRNLRPFYEALKESGNVGYVYGPTPSEPCSGYVTPWRSPSTNSSMTRGSCISTPRS